MNMEPSLREEEASAGRAAGPAVWVLALLLCLAVLWSYRAAITAPLVFDSQKIVTTRLLRSTWPIRPFLQDRRWVGYYSLALNYAVGGTDVRGYNLANIAIHLAAGLALLGIVRRTLLLESTPPTLRPRATWLGFAVALIWLVHPLQTQAVSYTIQRFESLMAMFYLLCLYCVVRGARARHAWPWYLAALACGWLGMGTKEVTATLPLVLLMYDRIFLAESWSQLARQRWWLYLGLLAAVVWLTSYLGRAVDTSRPSASAGLAVREVTPWQYLRTQPEVILHYLRLAAWPNRLCIDYRWPIAEQPLRIYGPGLVILGLLAASGVALWRRPWVGFLGLTFFLILAPTSSILPIVDLAFEHRMYLPLAAVATLVVLGAHLLVERLVTSVEARQLVQVAALVLVALGLILRTSARNRDYRDVIPLWAGAAEVNPRNDRAFNQWAVALAARGQTDEAIEKYERGLELNPASVPAHLSLVPLLLETGRAELALRHCQEAIRLSPGNVVAQFNLGVCLERLGRTDDALRQYEAALEIDPNYEYAHNAIAVLLAGRGQYEEAERRYQQAIRANPRYIMPLVNLGDLYRRRGYFADAETQYRRALDIEPYYVPARLFLALALEGRGRWREALPMMREAVRLAPRWPEPRLRLAWLLATSPEPNLRNGAEAVRLAEQAAAEMPEPTALSLDVLAAAQAEAGQFSQAVDAAKKALERVDTGSWDPSAETIRQRLALYQDNRPFRQSAP